MTRDVSLVDQQGNRIRNKGALLVDSSVSQWYGFPLEVRSSSGSFEAGHRHNQYPMVYWHQKGQVSVSETVGGRDASVVYRAGCVSVVEQGYGIDRTAWTSDDSVINCIEVRANDLRGLLMDEEQPTYLNTLWLNTDQTLMQIMAAMRAELESGCQSGRLFAEGLSLAVLGHLRARYGTRIQAGSTRSPRRLCAKDITKVRSHIQDQIDRNFSIADLASVLCMSGGHFARLFKESTGETPYRFVQQQRVARAVQLLSTSLGLAEIAQAVGFSSQAHFTQVFRQFTGSTPGRVRWEQGSSRKS